jgi:molybdopterin synthase sulfur carrier subunit
MSKPVTVLYFAWLRERTGTPEERIDLPPGCETVGALVAWLSTRSPAHASAFAAPNQVRAAVNQVFAQPGTPIAPGDELAFFPPVTGG